MDIKFWVNLIKVEKEQSVEAAKSLKANCTYVDNWFWIFEGDTEALEEDGVKFKVVSEGAVGSLGDLTREELVELCEDVFGIDIYKLSPEEDDLYQAMNDLRPE